MSNVKKTSQSDPPSSSAPTSHRLAPKVLALARRQHGVASRLQLVALGLSHRQIDRIVASGILVPLFRGVFAVGHDVVDLRGTLYAGLLAGGPGAVVSHQSAAALWGVLPAGLEVEVTRPSSPNRQPDPPRRDRHQAVMRLRIHRTRCLTPEDFTIEAGLPVTTFARTMLNISASFSTRNLERALTEGARRGILDWPALSAVLRRGSGWKGIARLREVVERWNPESVLTKSDLEILFLRLAGDAGLPAPELNVDIGDIEVDYLWINQKMIVELDAYSTHGDVFSFERDRNRDAYLKSGGFEVFRVTDRMLATDADQTISRIGRMLKARTQMARFNISGSTLPPNPE